MRGRSALPVWELDSGTPIEPGRLYVIPAGRDLTLSAEGTASITARLGVVAPSTSPYRNLTQPAGPDGSRPGPTLYA